MQIDRPGDMWTKVNIKGYVFLQMDQMLWDLDLVQ
jgi:hypothetical protein